jgi:hypothetical protein
MVDVASIFEPVSPDDIPSRASGQRVRTSAPILDAFVDSGEVVTRIPTARLDADPKEVTDKETGETHTETQDEANQRRANSLLSSLSLYALNNKYPVEVFSRAGDTFLRRLDLEVDDEGNTQKIPWTPREPKPRAVAADGESGYAPEAGAEDEYEGAEA